ncbi:hypothetical protein D1AOALGA4SA_3566 [Olavius algarvensis Delta 1 endosymbiont]|nr:hypothetical protein D1AOALGA4SA_3566 [Olavius algarvensis Delta 1 endosymbiont]
MKSRPLCFFSVFNKRSAPLSFHLLILLGGDKPRHYTKKGFRV